MRRSHIRAFVLVGLVSIAVALFIACGGGISQSEYDSVKQQLVAREQEAARLQQDVARAQQEVQSAKAGTGAGGGQQQMAALQEQLAAKQKEVDDLKRTAGYTGSPDGKTPMIWTEVRATPTPRPPATPVPPGYVAPTPVPPDAAWVDQAIPFAFYVEQLTGHQTSQVFQQPSCVPNSQFQRGAHVVWRFEVIDTSTGRRITNLDSPAIKLVLPDGKELAARYSKRAGTGPWMWAAAWDVPFDWPLGTLDYQIVVTDKAGRTGTFDQDTLALVNKDRGIDSRLQIVP